MKKTLAAPFLLASFVLVACKQDEAAPPVSGTASTGAEAPIATATATATVTVTVASTASALAAPSATPSAARGDGVVVHPSAEPARDAKIQTRFGKSCRLERTCGALWGIDCDAAVDGPYYYVKANTMEEVSACGGLCMGGRCTNCPPKEWGCTTY